MNLMMKFVGFRNEIRGPPHEFDDEFRRFRAEIRGLPNQFDDETRRFRAEIRGSRMNLMMKFAVFGLRFVAPSPSI